MLGKGMEKSWNCKKLAFNKKKCKSTSLFTNCWHAHNKNIQRNLGQVKWMERHWSLANQTCGNPDEGICLDIFIVALFWTEKLVFYTIEYYLHLKLTVGHYLHWPWLGRMQSQAGETSWAPQRWPKPKRMPQRAWELSSPSTTPPSTNYMAQTQRIVLKKNWDTSSPCNRLWLWSNQTPTRPKVLFKLKVISPLNLCFFSNWKIEKISQYNA